MSDYAPPDSPMYDFSNAARVGPGAWVVMLLMAVRAKDKVGRFWVCQQIREFCHYFKCGDCRPHAIAYITKYPPERDIEGEYSLFDWIVGFMNSVNKRIGKPLYDRDILLRQFEEDDFMVCEAGCGEAPLSKPKEVHRKKVPVKKFTIVHHRA